MDYSAVSTWDDLIQTNIDFLEGRLQSTFYYLAPWRDDMQHNEDNLLKLHKEHKIFTFNGQEGSFKKQQRSYLNFICSYDLGNKLKDVLLKDERLYVCHACAKTQEQFNNYPSEHFPLTYNNGKEFTWFNLKGCVLDYETKIVAPEILQLSCLYASESVFDLILDSMCFYIATRELPDKEDHELPETTACLLQALER